jgi:hypothetical protein
MRFYRNAELFPDGTGDFRGDGFGLSGWAEYTARTRLFS